MHMSCVFLGFLTNLVCTIAHSPCDTELDSCKELVIYVKMERGSTCFWFSPTTNTRKFVVKVNRDSISARTVVNLSVGLEVYI